jgi:hypothetical protein
MSRCTSMRIPERQKVQSQVTHRLGLMAAGGMSRSLGSRAKPVLSSTESAIMVSKFSLRLVVIKYTETREGVSLTRKRLGWAR